MHGCTDAWARLRATYRCQRTDGARAGKPSAAASPCPADYPEPKGGSRPSVHAPQQGHAWELPMGGVRSVSLPGAVTSFSSAHFIGARFLKARGGPCRISAPGSSGRRRRPETCVPRPETRVPRRTSAPTSDHNHLGEPPAPAAARSRGERGEPPSWASWSCGEPGRQAAAAPRQRRRGERGAGICTGACPARLRPPAVRAGACPARRLPRPPERVRRKVGPVAPRAAQGVSEPGDPQLAHASRGAV